jgi:hypothetical protein
MEQAETVFSPLLPDTTGSHHKGFEPADYIEARCCNCRHWIMDPQSKGQVGQCPFQYNEEKRQFEVEYSSNFCCFVDRKRVEEKFIVCDKKLLAEWKAMEQYA